MPAFLILIQLAESSFCYPDKTLYLCRRLIKTNETDMTHELNDGNYAAFVQKNTVAMIDCWAPWCGPCRMLSPVVDQIADEMDGKVAVGKVNVDDNQQICEQFGIMSIPTLLIFKNGELAERLTGAHPKATIQDKLNGLL